MLTCTAFADGDVISHISIPASEIKTFDRIEANIRPYTCAVFLFHRKISFKSTNSNFSDYLQDKSLQ